jgi:integrase
VLKSGSIRYYPIISINGKRTSLGGFARKKDAEARLRKAHDELVFGPEDISFAEYAKTWLSDCASISVSPHSYQDYETITRLHLVPTLGPLKLSKITPAQIQKIAAEKVKKGYAPKTVKNILNLLHGILKHAVSQGYISRNPVESVKAPRIPKAEMDFLRPAEIRKLLKCASPEVYPMIAMSIFTGIRQGELLGLRWCDIDFDHSIINIRRSYNRQYGFGPPKSKAGIRSIRMGPGLVKTLEGHRGDPDELVFSTKAGTPINQSNLIKREFHPALKRAGLRRIRWHDLRHTYAALMIAQNCNLKLLQTWMGHASISITLDRYGHLLPFVDEGVECRAESFVFDSKVVHFRLPRNKRAKPEQNSEASKTLD